jgi:tetratricopeptide (TPR) repeat protein
MMGLTALVSAFGVLTTTARADDPLVSWKGELIIQTKPSEAITFGNYVEGKFVNVRLGESFPIKVRDDRDGWLRIFDGHREGWARKDQFILSRDAPACFTDRVRTNPSDGWAWFMRALGWYVRGEYDNAIKDYAEAIRLNPKDAGAFSGRGVAWRARKEYDKAIKDYDEAIRLDPKLASAFFNRGNAWIDKKEYNKAVKDYDEAIRLEPTLTSAYLLRGYVRLTKNEYDKAIKDYDEAIRLGPQSSMNLEML